MTIITVGNRVISTISTVHFLLLVFFLTFLTIFRFDLFSIYCIIFLGLIIILISLYAFLHHCTFMSFPSNAVNWFSLMFRITKHLLSLFCLLRVLPQA